VAATALIAAGPFLVRAPSADPAAVEIFLAATAAALAWTGRFPSGMMVFGAVLFVSSRALCSLPMLLAAPRPRGDLRAGLVALVPWLIYAVVVRPGFHPGADSAPPGDAFGEALVLAAGAGGILALAALGAAVGLLRAARIAASSSDLRRRCFSTASCSFPAPAGWRAPYLSLHGGRRSPEAAWGRCAERRLAYRASRSARWERGSGSSSWRSISLSRSGTRRRPPGGEQASTERSVVTCARLSRAPSAWSARRMISPSSPRHRLPSARVGADSRRAAARPSTHRGRTRARRSGSREIERAHAAPAPFRSRPGAGFSRDRADRAASARVRPRRGVPAPGEKRRRAEPPAGGRCSGLPRSASPWAASPPSAISSLSTRSSWSIRPGGSREDWSRCDSAGAPGGGRGSSRRRADGVGAASELRVATSIVDAGGDVVQDLSHGLAFGLIALPDLGGKDFEETLMFRLPPQLGPGTMGSRWRSTIRAPVTPRRSISA